MLESLKILNGQMSPKFDKYTNVYTVSVATDITKLALDFSSSKGYTVEILGNEDLQEGENIVSIVLANGEEQNTYMIYVNKEESKEALGVATNYGEALEVKKEVPNYVAPLLGGTCFLIILLTFVILFHKKKQKKKL